MIIMWFLSICTFLVAHYTYGVQLYRVRPFSKPPVDRIAPITVLAVAATFFIILYIARTHKWEVALGSAFVGAAAAPMIFELPFDLIVMGMTYSPLPPYIATLDENIKVHFVLSCGNVLCVRRLGFVWLPLSNRADYLRAECRI
jgi:hypothetical protein